jgi:transcriptional regulator with XRE-family HTH domain
VSYPCRTDDLMARSRTKSPLLLAFGGVLQHLHAEHERRLGRPLSHDALARTVTDRLANRVSAVVSIEGSTLWRWESGEVRRPNYIVLAELAALYAVPIEAVMAVLEANVRDPALSTAQGLNILDAVLLSHGPGTDATASATRAFHDDRLFDALAQAAYAFRALAADATKWSNRLADLAGDYGVTIAGGLPAGDRADPSGSDADARPADPDRTATSRRARRVGENHRANGAPSRDRRTPPRRKIVG